MRLPALLVLLLIPALAGGCLIPDATPVEKLVGDLGSDRPAKRAEAEKELIDTGLDAVVPLGKLLETGSVPEKRLASYIIAAIVKAHQPPPKEMDPEKVKKGIAEARAILTAALAGEDADVDVLIYSLRGLAAIGRGGAVAPVANLLEKHLDLAVKHSAAETLAAIGRPAEDRLVRLGGDKKSAAYIRVLAVGALAKFSTSSDAVFLLVGILKQTGNPGLRGAAENALATICRRRRGHVAVVAAQLATRDTVVRHSFASVVARVGPFYVPRTDSRRQPLFESLFNRLLHDPHAPIRAMVVRSLTQTQGQVRLRGEVYSVPVSTDKLRRMRTYVIELLKREADAQVLVAAAWAAGRLDAEGAIDRLIELLDHDHAGVRHSAIRALRGLTAQRFGYRPLAPAASRAKAVGEWKKWRRGDTPD